ncbi:MAG: hypothetical protein EYC70_16315 [Planctomycetota bacterium]|nr:MAG: hypothetical protein EYC70_16315 [Planctomycetota bacterium]
MHWLPTVLLGCVAQDPLPDPLALAVLEQGGKTYTARDVMEALRRYDDTLPPAVERDADYRRIYLRSVRFLDQVHQFSNLLAVEAAGVPAVGRAVLLAEAAAWAADHGSSLPPEPVLAAHGLELEWRARLLSQQPAEYGTAQLRGHMLASVPEFFCELRMAAIRVPLVDRNDGSALPADERKARYDFVDGLAQRLHAGQITWEQAYEEAAQRYGSAGGDPKLLGALGWLKRRDLRRFEEPFLRHAFADLGFKRIEQPVLRGPIVGDLWIYLARVEAVLERGVVELERVRPQVERSLREKTLQAQLAQVCSQVQRRILAPVFLPE